MADSFRGEFHQKIDAKARVSIPAPFRRALEAGDPGQGINPRVVIVYGGDRAFLECYSLDEMTKVERRIARLRMGSPERRYLEHNMITLSQTLEIDSDGRVVLNQRVREKIGLANLRDGSDAVFAGTLDKFQIWRREDYVAQKASIPVQEILAEGEDMLTLLPPDAED
jgi:MraZ protein